jgi:hypothetical protein
VPVRRILDDFRTDAAAAAAAYGREGGVVVTGAEILGTIEASENTYVIVLGVPAETRWEKGAGAHDLRCRVETPAGLPETREALRGYRPGDTRLFTGMFLEMRPGGPTFSCFDTAAMDAAVERIRSGR